mmetsp:Transcript_8859/g.16119  ORF Transcript_8859/g.16119 Transcript_8859/m.16119 type:complete len:261 (+) Transcript_8859:1495-2277(+)
MALSSISISSLKSSCLLILIRLILFIILMLLILLLELILMLMLFTAIIIIMGHALHLFLGVIIIVIDDGFVTTNALIVIFGWTIDIDIDIIVLGFIVYCHAADGGTGIIHGKQQVMLVHHAATAATYTAAGIHIPMTYCGDVIIAVFHVIIIVINEDARRVGVILRLVRRNISSSTDSTIVVVVAIVHKCKPGGHSGCQANWHGSNNRSITRIISIIMIRSGCLLVVVVVVHLSNGTIVTTTHHCCWCWWHCICLMLLGY